MGALGDLPGRYGASTLSEARGGARGAPPQGLRGRRRGLGPVTGRADLVRRVGALAVAGVLLVVAGCGEETWGHSAVAQEQARAAVETWLGSCANEESEAVVEVLTPQTRELIFKAPSVLAGCARIARLGLPPDADRKQLEELFRTAHVEHTAVAAGFGTALVRSAKGTTSEFQVEFDRGRWILSNPLLGPPPPPPAAQSHPPSPTNT